MRTTIGQLARGVTEGQRLVMVTCYDYTSARLADRSGVDLLLVGDSLGMVMLGHDSTLPVTLEDMVRAARAVVRGSTRPLVVGDLPFLTYTTASDAVAAARRLMGEAGVQSVKLEGGAEVAPQVETLVQAGVPVMGHIGFTPQSVNQLGVRVQGRDAPAAAQLIRDALALEAAGAWAVVLELVPAQLAAEVTAHLSIPTIGIGAGAGCAGQVQVWHDLLGLYEDFVPRHARQFRTLADQIVGGLDDYVAAVRAGDFPGAEHAATMDQQVLAQVRGVLGPTGEGR
ncbi:3-methyl-2-oxobutanoate hydroxymethyltransferase [Intrasporangium chromatireducens Q5-1]|uniref:3-methyl-2-oxobutanoate hydroxymethyltransferase n=1 Tax=Intrasporangium chromatireducens Q5-1 TaxID=584657 RepID=W9GQK3_9MICO|nr:3-methyl-2-oxobutanoate hydroxymethyltransferase [Intrasporangium chromatireducens]EWT06154.1 3-methyl-2-oxobutanoate hydroxymethyltransferase [Intrasporangium chromatireducens Q5-1]